MKKSILVVILLLISISFYAQAPEKVNYQAVARNLTGAPLINQSINVKYEIRQGSSTGTVVYAENHALTTNQFGLFTAEIGGGTVITGSFPSIAWGTSPFYLYVEVDGDPMGVTQLLSVPYALYAKESGNGPAGLPGKNSLSVASAYSGPLCSANGGSQIDVGLDDNNDGILQAIEIDYTYYVCNGTDGIIGSNGLNTLSSTVASTSCANGGVTVNMGLDANNNSVLDASEISLSYDVCNGVDGLAGTNGIDGLNTIAETIPSTSCPNGGVTVNMGLDSNNNGILEPSEITTTYDVCNGIDGTSGTTYFAGTGISLSGDTITNLGDADADPTNEIQVLSISNDTIFLSNGGFAPLPSAGGYWVANGNDIYNSNTANVGIGTNTPPQKLSVLSNDSIIAGFLGTNPVVSAIAVANTNVGAATGILFFNGTDTSSFIFLDPTSKNFTLHNKTVGGNIILNTEKAIVNQAEVLTNEIQNLIYNRTDTIFNQSPTGTIIHVNQGSFLTDSLYVLGVNAANTNWILANDGAGQAKWTDPSTIISGAGDNWGTDVVNTSGTNISGDGTAGNPLTVTETTTTLVDNGNGTFTYTDETGTPITFDANIDDADADATNELELPMIGNTLGDVLVWNGTSWVAGTDQTADGDTDATNELELPTTATPGEVLMWNGSNWAPGTDQTADGDTDATNELELPTAATNGDVLTWNGTSWVNQAPTVGTDNQDLDLSGNTLSLTNDATPVDLTPYLDNTDNQALSISNDTLFLTNGGSVVLPSKDSTNIYNSDGTLTGTRTVTQNANNITYVGGGINPTAIFRNGNAVGAKIQIDATNAGASPSVNLTNNGTNWGGISGTSNGLLLNGGTGGNVGIGVSPANGRFVVQHAATSAYPTIKLNQTDLNLNRVHFTNTPVANKYWEIAAETDANDNNAGYSINYYNGSTYNIHFLTYGDGKTAINGSGFVPAPNNSMFDVFGTSTIHDSLSVKTSYGDGYTFPVIDGNANYIMRTDGAGNLSWVDPSTLGGNSIYTGSGSLSGNTVVTGGANTLSFTSTSTNGFSVDGSTFSVDAANNTVGIGTISPFTKLHVAENTNSVIFNQTASNVANTQSGIINARSRGTITVPTAVQSGDSFGEFGFMGYDGTGFNTPSAGIRAAATENFSATNQGAALFFSTTPNGSTITTDRMMINHNGFVGIGTNGPISELDVNGQITMRTGAVNGYIPVSDVNGTMTWTDPSTLGLGGAWTSNGTETYLNSINDKVGIGLNSPTEELHIVDNISLRPQVLLETTAGNFAIGYRYKTALAEWFMGQEEVGNQQFRIKDVFNSKVTMAISPGTGNVGIGTTTTNSTLTVNGDVGLNDGATVSTNNAVTILLTNSGPAVNIGDIVVVGAADNSFNVTNNPAHYAVIGVATETIGAGAVGKIAISGVVTVNIESASSVLRGQHCITGSNNGRASGVSIPSAGTSIGVYLTNGPADGTAKVLLR